MPRVNHRLAANSRLPANTAVVGLQWGDEGKGKIVDVLTEGADVVVRYCGGANAGHTVRIGEKKFATHLLPVGVFRANIVSCIGNGVVLDPLKLFEEIDAIGAQGIAVTPANLKVSYKAHVVMPWHKVEDGARETAAAGQAIGTTRRGIGPAYADKMHRSTAIRVADLVDEKRLKAKIDQVGGERNQLFERVYGQPLVDLEQTFEQYREAGKRLAPFVDDVGFYLLNARSEGKRVVFEGANAALLDVDHGTYPYVTSSNCSALGLFTGSGVPPTYVSEFLGIVKAYSTRVGAGAFPTELHDAIGDGIRTRGREFGTTTGRPRRIGWFDAVAVRYAADLSGVTAIAITLLDVLGGVDELRICTSYDSNGKRLPYFIADGLTLADVTPVYESLPGWTETIDGCKTFEQLPANAQAYVRRIEALLGVPATMVSVGPERTQTLVR